MKSLNLKLFTVAMAAVLPALANTEQFNFDSVGDGTLINSYYSWSGVTFDCRLGTDSILNACFNTNLQGFGGNVFARTPTEFVSSPCNNQGGLVPTPSLAHSPSNVVSVFQPISGCQGAPTDFNELNGYVVARFENPVASVSIWANAIFPRIGEPIRTGTSNLPYLNAYDSNGKYLVTAQYSNSPLTASLGWKQLTITPSMVGNTPIGMVLFSSSVPPASDFFTMGRFDDLSFTLPSCSAPVTVPFLDHLPATTAENDLVADGLAVGMTTYQRSTVPLGDVISTNFPASTSVCPGTKIDLLISSGSNPLRIP